MTEIEQKAFALLNEVLKERESDQLYASISRASNATAEALCRAIEQHEAYKQEVSDAVETIIKTSCSDDVWRFWANDCLKRFILPKPDPLADAWIEATGNTVGMGPLNEALAKRGFKIVEDV